MTPERANRINSSVQFMLILAEMIKMEHASDLIDSNFKNPMVNQFASRIAKDATAIKTHLMTNDRVKVLVSDNEFFENYAGEMYRVFKYFIGLPLSQVREVMDKLHTVSEAVEV